MTILAVFVIKVLELSLENLRLLLMVHDWPILASTISAVDCFLSLLALKYVVENLKTWRVYAAYALGYGCGNCLGYFAYRVLGG